MGGGGIAIIVTSSRLQVTLRVETCVELELNLPECDLEPSLLIGSYYREWKYPREKRHLPHSSALMIHCINLKD